MNILGINAFHGDAAACLVRDGKLIAAVEEERFRRIKHWAGFPEHAIRYCLDAGGLAPADVDHIAVNQDSTANLAQRIGFALQSRPDLAFIVERIRNRRRRAGIADQLQTLFPGEGFRAELNAIEHHRAHLASAFYASPFDEAVVVSIDGFGDFASAAWGVGRGTRIEIDQRVYFPHSLGIFYQALTQYLGFTHYGDEYKVMGLAAYGEPSFTDALRRIVALDDDGAYRLDLDYFRHAREKVLYEWENGAPVVGTLYTAELEKLLGPARHPNDSLEPRHRDIACSVQALFENALFALLNALHAKHRLANLAIAGGCAMNSLANGKLAARTPFASVYVPAAPGDAGGAMGAAYSVWHGNDGGRVAAITHPSWGIEFDDAAIRDRIEKRRAAIEAARCVVERVDDDAGLCRTTAAAIADGEVVGWFQGRMEWGPRALGNRSIVCDPRRADMKETLNRKIKRRESFRPFAPSVLHDAVAAWFEHAADVPFMSQVVPIRAEKRALIPAVTHVDGTGRLQTVQRDAHPLYFGLIEAFGDLTGVPMVLNTSFNENEPIVCTPDEALDCFLRTGMDRLAMGHWVLRRIGADARETRP